MHKGAEHITHLITLIQQVLNSQCSTVPYAKSLKYPANSFPSLQQGNIQLSHGLHFHDDPVQCSYGDLSKGKEIKSLLALGQATDKPTEEPFKSIKNWY